MISLILTFIFCFCSAGTFSAEEVQQVDKSVKVQGYCYDVATAVALKTKATAILKSGKINLGESDSLGIFNIKIPDATKFILFESAGYQSIKLPTNLGDEAGTNVKFAFYLPMAALDSQRVEQRTMISMSFMYVDSMNVEYVLTSVDNSNRLSLFSGYSASQKKLISIHIFGGGQNEVQKPGQYLLTGHTTDGRLVVEESVTIKPGLNFKSIIVKNRGANSVRKTKSAYTPRENATLYFDQSSYDLRSVTKASLDSIAQYLLDNESKILQITGHTDNVGRRNLNVILSEYRARRIANYLNRMGVPSERIIFSWEGPDLPVAPNDSEENKAKNRRAVTKIVDKH